MNDCEKKDRIIQGLKAYGLLLVGGLPCGAPNSNEGFEGRDDQPIGVIVVKND